MKLTLGKLRSLIKEVVKENKMNLMEDELDMNFKELYNMLSDQNPKAGLQRIGVMTAENPRGVESDEANNAELMRKFKSELDKKGLDYISIGGKYGNPENSLIIINPTMLDMVQFGKEYGQAVVIYGQRMRRLMAKDQAEYTPIFFRFDYIQTEPDGYDEPAYDPQEYYVKDSTDMIVKTEADDYYSELKGTKFSIPFFTDMEHLKMPKTRYTTATDVEGEVEALKGKYDKV
jgi:hypothetical protein